MFDQGLYVFLMRLKSPATIEVGALGRFVFPAGWYAYTGSAKRSLKKRVERHWAVKKTVRWHIDYLSTAPDSEPVGAVIVPLDAMDECALNRLVGQVVRGPSPAPGFGAGDCRAKCPAHLWFSVSAISLLTLARVHPRAAVLMPGADFGLEQLHLLGEIDSP